MTRCSSRDADRSELADVGGYMADQPRLGFIGTGTQGRGLLNNFLRQPDTRVLAVCDVDTNRREHHRKIVDEFYRAQQSDKSSACAETSNREQESYTV